MRISSRPMMILAIIAMFALFAPLAVSFGQTDCSLDGGIDRVSGSDRYDTSAALARECYDSPENVVIATGENFADALAASTLAAAHEGPILLVKKNTLPSTVKSALNDLEPDKAFIVGGTGAVSTSVENAIREAGEGIAIQRLSGADRYGTSAAIANEIEEEVGNIDTVVIATGENFPDALAASSMAASELMPILLVKKNEVPSSVENAIKDLEPDLALVIGGTAVISGSTEDDIDADTERLAGLNRYETAEDVREYAIDEFGMDETTLWVASGTNYPDALVAGPVAGSSEENAPIMLVNNSTPADPTVRNFFEDFGEDFDDIVIIGGTAAISASMENFIDDAMDGIIDDEDDDDNNNGDEDFDVEIDVDYASGDANFDVTVHVEDEDNNDAENIDIELEVKVKQSGSSSYSDDLCLDSDDDIIDDCTDRTNDDGDAVFSLPAASIGSGDQVRISAEVDDNDGDGSDTITVTIP